MYGGEVGCVLMDMREKVYDWSSDIEDVVEKIDVGAKVDVLFASVVE